MIKFGTNFRPVVGLVSTTNETDNHNIAEILLKTTNHNDPKAVSADDYNIDADK